MKKLTEKDLGPYLGCGVILEGFHDIQEMKGFVIDVININDRYEYKPIFRRLSTHLTQEITEGGETFVPIVRLACMADGNAKWLYETIKKDEREILIPGASYEVSQIRQSVNWGDLSISFHYHQGMNRFGMRDNTRKIPLAVAHQLEMFEKLREWKFWLGDESYFDEGIILDNKDYNVYK